MEKEKAKYRFKKQFKDARIVINGSKEEITADNLTDEKAEYIIRAHPHLAHNLETVSGEDVVESPESDDSGDEAPKKRGRGKTSA